MMAVLVVPAVARADNAQPLNQCQIAGPASPQAQTAVAFACAAWRARTPYTWGGGHNPGYVGPTYGSVDWSDVQHSWRDPWIKGLDCSGFVRWAWYRAMNRDILPGTALDQYRSSNAFQVYPAHNGGSGIEGYLLAGDLVFTSGNGSVADISHVMLYLGDGKVVEEWQSGEVARVTTLASRTTDGRLVGAVRVRNQGALEQPGNYSAANPAIDPNNPFAYVLAPGAGGGGGGGNGIPERMWATDVNVRLHPNRSASVVTNLPSPTMVYVRCQQHGESVTDEGYTNDAWSYLPDLGGWISNIYLQGPAWFSDVPQCGTGETDSSIGSGSSAPNGAGGPNRTWGTDVAVRSTPYTDSTSTVLTRLTGPTAVQLSCQKHAQTVTAEGYTNDAWSYLPQYGGWISNIYLQGDAWIAGIPSCDGKGTPTPAGTRPGQTWGTDVALRVDPSTSSGLVTRLSAPTAVAISCQKHAQSVTAEGYTNDAWSYLPQYGGWISNIYLQGDAWLAGVPAC
ncbi:C40 family peptidase [Streptomyces asoensis]